MSKRKLISVHVTQMPRFLTLLGAEGEVAKEAAVRELVEEIRNTKLKHPVVRHCRCMCGCNNSWRDEYDWLRSLGSCPQCHETEHVEELFRKTMHTISGEGS